MKLQPSGLRRLVIGTLMTSALLAAGSLANIAQAAVNFRVYSSLTADDNSAHYIWFKRFQSNVEKDPRLKNKIKLNYFPNAMLGKEADATQQVRIGAINMMISGTSIWATIAPEIGVLYLGYLFKDRQQVGKALDGKAGDALSDLMLKKANIVVLGYAYNLGARNIYTKKVIEKPEDLKNLKIRVLPVPNFIATINHMGAVAIPMPGGEVYSSLQMGVIDGLEHDSATVLANKFYEIAKNAVLTQHIYNPIMIAINNRSFQQIPENLRPAFIAAARKATEYERQQSSVVEQNAVKQLKSLGMVFHDIDRDTLRAEVKPVWDAFLTKYPQMKPVVDDVAAAE
ncbi:TRAP transporter substrate-binding protein [Candidatus Sodalis endolongispinus]|uniref:TRAP transporter substrate-binding protein n=1 Tax=Candidatus Sodalis endolongispinus TaxID=2812662 RepID=A0ABS5YD73_9GAMM|nr:TRAP transporter substrate-binding protein [Candidatus Sodalis endolongispinus]MBT9432898.1 TRAP transporter substrate-binding protein [Candidatus Sodalis endolongispinus]